MPDNDNKDKQHGAQSFLPAWKINLSTEMVYHWSMDISDFSLSSLHFQYHESIQNDGVY